MERYGEILTPEKLAEIMEVSRRSVIENREIPRLPKKIGRAVRFKTEEVEAWLTGRTYDTRQGTYEMLNRTFAQDATIGGLSRLFRVWHRDMKAANPPLNRDALVEWLHAD